MKSSDLFKPLAISFAAALVIYFVFYTGIERRRTRLGPWQITFTANSNAAPSLLISQPALAITNVQITFSDAAIETNLTTALDAAQPRPVPFDVPYGKCVFMDTTFLPGTIVFEMFGHEIQLIPRVLTIDRKEQPWRSNEIISLTATNSPRRKIN